MQSAARFTTAIAAAIALTGCSLFGPRMQTVTISSDPIGAHVLVNGEEAGATPLRYRAPRSEDLLIEVRSPGYRTEYRTSMRKLSTLGILDVIGGSVILLPYVGLFSSAAWQHDPAAFGVILAPEEDPKP